MWQEINAQIATLVMVQKKKFVEKQPKFANFWKHQEYYESIKEIVKISKMMDKIDLQFGVEVDEEKISEAFSISGNQKASEVFKGNVN